MNIGVLIPGFSSDENDPAIPVQLNLAREQARHLDLRIIALRYPHRRDQYGVFGAQVYSLGYGAWTRGARRLQLWLETYRLLSRLHREQPFDVLHAMWADETGLIAGWFGKTHNIPVVVSILGGELAALHDIGYGGQLSRFGRWTTGQALRYATRVHIPSGYVNKLLEQSSYAVDARRIDLIPLGIDADLFHPDNTSYDPKRLICVASLIPVKDHATLLRAVARLPNVTLDLVGDGIDRAWLESMARDLGITAHINFLGAIPHHQLPAYYRRCALHILTSRHETFALSIAEAAACGVPSISTGVGMLPDYPAIGYKVAIGDPAALAEQINILLSDTSMLGALRKSARASVERDLTITHMATRLRELYAELR